VAFATFIFSGYVVNTSSTRLYRVAAALSLCLLAGASQAHTGHGTSGLWEGLAHPGGLDHLLAMVAVGLWSISALPASKVVWGPATFMMSLIVGAVLGVMGVTVPFLEHMISLSVVLFGIMLVLAQRKIPTALGLSGVALAAFFHGIAHGAESPQAAFASYAAGFLLTTAALHFGGVLAGLFVRGFVPGKARVVLTGLGALCSITGVYLWGQN
jgi:urease accessory protein